jgi:hypothetical protein
MTALIVFCSRLRSGLLLDRLGTHTRLTPTAFARALMSTVDVGKLPVLYIAELF